MNKLHTPSSRQRTNKTAQPARYGKIPLYFGLLALAAPPAILAADTAATAETVKPGLRTFNIGKQPLYAALNALAEQAGVQFVFTEEMVKGLSSPGASGQLSLEEALSRVLQGTGLGYRLKGGNTITLEAKPVEPKSHITDPSTLPAVKVSGKALYEPSNPYNTDYKSTQAFSATKTDTLIMETPTTVQVVPRAVLDDQKAARITDALENVSGVYAQPSLGIGNSFIVRGFRNDKIYRNGLKSNNLFAQEYDTANLQNIEVLKGPAQLYGRTEPGGLISLTTKKPLDIPYYSLEQRFGSYDLYRTEWDATGPLNNDKTLLYRFTGSYQNNNSFRDFVFNDRMLFAPSITWRPTDATDVTLDLQVQNQDFISDYGIPVIGNRPAQIPITRSLGDPNTPKSNLNLVQLGSLLNHRFNDDWAIHSRFLATFDHGDETFVNPAPAFDASALDQTTGILQRNVFNNVNNDEAYATNLDLTGRFNLGFSKHDVLLGFDFYRAIENYRIKGYYDTPNPALAINIYNPGPGYGIPRSVFDSTFLSSSQPGGDYSVFFNQWEGVYFQDQITLWNKLHIMGGGRYDWAETAYGNGGSLSEANALLAGATRKDQGFSPRAGILYQALDELSFYANWTTSFGANNGVSATGGSLKPQIAEQFEAGIKTMLFDDRLLANLAYYHLTKENILTPDLSTAFLYDYLAIGQQRSQGIEVDITGRFSDALSVIGNYAYTDARVTKDNSSLEGNRLPNVPEDSGSLWLKYDFSGYKALNGFSMGLGTVAAGKREGDLNNSFQLPGYVRMDAFAAYKWHINKTKLTAQFNIRNILDKQYYASTDPNLNVAPALGVAPGAPLMAIGSIKVEF